MVFPQLLFSILDNWSSILLVPFFTDILYSYLNKGKKEKEHDFCVKSMHVSGMICLYSQSDMQLFMIPIISDPFLLLVRSQRSGPKLC